MGNLEYGIIGLVVVLLSILILYLFNKKPKTKAEAVIDSQQLNQLYNALGKGENILKISLEHQRLKVDLKDFKKVDQATIKALNIPAFQTGKTLKLLIKSSPDKVLSYLENKRKEAN